MQKVLPRTGKQNAEAVLAIHQAHCLSLLMFRHPVAGAMARLA